MRERGATNPESDEGIWVNSAVSGVSSLLSEDAGFEDVGFCAEERLVDFAMMSFFLVFVQA